MTFNIFALSVAAAVALLVLAARIRARVVRWRFARLTRELSLRWRLLDHQRKLGVLKALGVSTMKRVPSPVLDGLYDGVLASCRTALKEDADLAEVEVHLRMAFATQRLPASGGDAAAGSV